MNLDNNIDGFEFSENQKNLWNLKNLNEFHNQIKLEIKSKITGKDLVKTIENIISKNEILNYKTILKEGLSYPLQSISNDNKTEWFEVDYSENFEQIALRTLDYDYDSSINNPIRFCLVTESENVKFIYVRFYALWSDSYSPILFCKSLFDDLNLNSNANVEEDENGVIEYSGFSSWQNELISEPEPEAILFWKKYNFDFKKRIIPFQNDEAELFQPKKLQICKIENENYAEVISFCKNEGINKEHFLLNQFLKYLFLFEEDQITLGYVPFQRKYKELQNTFGFVNTIIPMIFENISNLEISEYVNYISNQFDSINDWTDFFTLDRENKTDNDPYFKYNFEFIDLSEENHVNSNFKISDLFLIQDAFDIKLSCVDFGDSLTVELYLNDSVFGTVEQNILKHQISGYFTKSIPAIDKTVTITEFENDIISKANATNESFQEVNSILELFDYQVKNSPDAIALANENFQISYNELNKKANQFKNYLIEKHHVQKGDAVCFIGNATEWYVISVLGILKAGAYYVPIDVNYPIDRVNFILEETKSKVLICDPNATLDLNLVENNSVIPSYDEISKYEDFDHVINVTQNDIAYCIYTSGSTGKPKGCIINQSNLLNYIQWSNSHYFENENSGNWGLFTSISFDLSVTALFTTLTRGKKLWISNFDKEVNVLLKESFLNPEIDTIKITPAHISLLKDLDIKNSAIQRIICGGEKLFQYQLDIIRNINKDIKVYNEYGPTEATVGCIVSEVSKCKNKIVIGNPIANTQIYILDDALKLINVGQIGEIHIGGSSLSQGYWNREDLTNEKFIVNPFNANEKIYKTGDLACWLADGTIEYFGRKDFQVKIRGYRIELGEIENLVLQFSTDINQVVVDVNEKNNDKLLIAYLVTNKNIDKNQLRDFLKQKLPNYMIPNHFVDIAQLPLTTNGKIDRKALGDINFESILKNEYVAPSNDTQKKIVEIWQDLLKNEKIGIRDNFIDLGGHSLIAVQVFNRIFKELGKSISLKLFFENPTIEALVAQLQEDNYVAIEKAPESVSYPLTAAQMRLWILSQLDGGSLAYNMPTAVKLTGVVDANKFEESFRLLIKRHEILRTYFKTNCDGEVRQFIIPSGDVNFTIDQVDYTLEDNKEATITSYLQERNNEIFDLKSAPLLRASLIKLDQEEYVFFLSLHHIIGDGWSMELMVSEVVKNYNALVQGKDIDLPELNIQYKDYAVWLNNALQQEKQQESEQYWLEQFANEVPVLDLPSFKSRPLVQTYNGDKRIHQFSASFLERLKTFSKECDVTMFMTLMTGINALLHKYTGQYDIILGTPIAGREHPDLENQMGLYLNTLAIRTQFNENQSFLDLVAAQKEILLGAYEHQNYPFDALVGKLNLKRDSSRSALFDVMVVLQSQSQLNNFDKEELSDLVVSKYALINKTSKFDLNFTFIETDGLCLVIDYNSDIYDSYQIERMLVHFENLVTASLVKPDTLLHSLGYLAPAEEHQLIELFNETTTNYPKNKTIVDLFEEQATLTPDNIAVVFEDKVFTYKELNAQANQLGYYIKEKYDVQPDDLIGIKLERSERMIISILGILKSGAAYVPIDINYPQERVEYIEKDSNSKFVIVESFFDKFNDVRQNYSKNNGEKSISGNDLAYVIYTSGSTGNPKGVMIEHSSLTNYVSWGKESYLKSDLANTNFGLFTSLSFDLTVTSLFLPLISGGTLKIMDSTDNVQALLEQYLQSEISCIKLTPSHINVIDTLDIKTSSIGMAVVGGEELQQIHIDILRKLNPSIKIYNEYGPTETTVGCNIYEVKSSDEAILIGTPIANTSLFILDNFQELSAQGVTGEICIGGSGLARGYLNRPDLTAEKFINNPFKAGERLYRTGDLGRWLPDGNMEFLGRKDHQVKIRGYRIELGEIENAILDYSDILKQVVVEVKEVNKNKALVAYFVSASSIDKVELRSFLQERLPDYMVPGFYAELEAFPLTPNGKINRKALPSLGDEDLVRKEYIAPETKVEEKLAEIWQEVLGIEKIGTTDNFFELGGHSLILGQVINRIQKQLGKTISFKVFFANPTIKGLSAQLIDNQYEAIPKASQAASYPLTASQNRFWVLNQLKGGGLAYNMPGTVKLTGNIDIDKFEESFSLLIERHEILRTSFKTNEEGEIRQYIEPITNINFKINIENFIDVENQDQRLANYLQERNSISFDLEQPQLIRASLIEINKEEYVFFLSMHHIIGDGWSLELLISEIVKIYNALVEGKKVDLAALSIQYKDYAVWLNTAIQQEKQKSSEQYWLDQFTGELPVLDLPSFKARPIIQTYNGDHVSYQFSQTFLDKLKAFSKKNDVTLFMTLMGAVNSLFHKYTGQYDIILGTPIAGRDHPDLENQLGLYLNTLAIRTQFDKEYSFLDIVNIQKEILLGAYEHQNYPFDALVSKLNLKHDSSRSALFDVMVVLQSQGQLNNVERDELSNLVVSNYSLANMTSKFDLSLTFFERDGLVLSIDYNSDIYDSYLIDRIFVHFENLVIASLEKPDTVLHAIGYLSPVEEYQLLEIFNDNSVIYPKDKTIIDLFEKQVTETPDNIALVFEEKIFTYKEVNEKANQLGNCLIEEYDISKGDIVGVQLSRSDWAIVSILAILKTGAVYLPIDSELPNKRKKFIIEDTELKLLITESALISDLDFYKEDALILDKSFTSSNFSIEAPKSVINSQDLAYIIYTSGSTGEPKGVMIEHVTVINTILSQIDNFNLQEYKKSLQFASFSFDASIWEIFITLLSGSSLYVVNDEVKSNSRFLEEYILKNEIEIATLPPAYLKLMNVESLKNLKILITAGEAAIYDKAKEFLKYGTFYNAYGPTETSICGTIFKVQQGSTLNSGIIPIGTPIANASILILDEFNNLMACGATGEICIGGSGLARGYLNRPDLTAQKFINHPFNSGERLYKTGDLGRLLPDGNIEFLGRIDDQVKIRGHRIELGEIEQLISNQDFVNQAIVVVKENEGEKFIVAYYVSDNDIDKKVLQNNLNEVLPDHMLPSYYVQLETIPLTSNGKIDHKALPNVDEKDLIKEEYIAPRTKEEEILVSIWSEVLKHDQISVKDSFYNLGGDSIKSIQVVSRLKQSGYTLKVEQILRVPVIEGLAKLMEHNTIVINQSKVTGDVELTPIQYYFFENEMISNKNHYNQSVTLKSKSFIDSTILERAVSSLVLHHDALRMTYNFENNFWLQYNQDSSEDHYKINFYDLRNEQDELAALNKLGNELQSGFDISSGVLFHIGHFRMSDGDRLALIIHHLVIDGISWRILLEDLSNLYESYQANKAITLPLKTDSFQRWASLQKEYAKSEKMQKERLYWQEVTKQSIALLPLDQNISEVSEGDKSNSFVLDATVTQKLQTQVHHVYNTEINDILLAGLGLAIRDVLGVEKSVVKMEGHGREEIIEGIDVGRTLGWFTSVYPFVLDVSDSKGNELVAVKESLRNIPNKGVGYGILNYLDKRFLNELIPSIQFNYLGDFGKNVGGDKNKPLFEFSSESIGSSISSANRETEVLLDVSGIMVSDQLRMSISYSVNSFNPETIEKLVTSYKNHLIEMIDALSETKENHLTPSDLTFKKLTYAEILELNSANNVEDIYELSPLQQGLYYHWLVDNSSYMYFEQLSYRLHFDNLSIDTVKQAFQELINRYAVLRTSFTNDHSGVPLQIVHKSVSNNFSYESALHVTSIDDYLDEIKEKDKAVGFDLEQPSQMRLKMVSLGNGDYEFIWSSHHILMDGWCLSILINDFYRMLMAINNNQLINLPEPAKYSEYINWLSKVDKDLSLEYWKNYLQDLESTTEIPFKNKKEKIEASVFKTESLAIEGELFDNVKMACHNIGITINTFTQGVWGYLLSQYNNAQDVVFGSVVSGRPGELPGVESMIGLFINTIPVRVKYTETDTPETYLKRLHFETLESTSHHYLNLSEVQSQSVLKMGLINHLIIFENYLVQESVENEVKELYGQKEETVSIEGITSFEQTNYDFSVTVAPSQSSLKIGFTYNPVVFDSELIKNVTTHFSNVVKQFTSEGEVFLSKIEYITPSEKNQVLIDFNDTKVDYPQDKTIIELFEEQVYNTPNNIALVFEDKRLTYKELNEKANQLGAYLRNTYNILPDDLVGIKLDRSDRMILSILGILKSGGAYVPIDTNYPEERVHYVQNDCQAKVIIDEKELELFYQVQDQNTKVNLEKVNQPSDLAYVIYTSGTTGHPKGVMVMHHNVVRLVKPCTYFPLNEENILLSTGSVSFDATIIEFFGALLNGSKLILTTQDNLLDIDQLEGIVQSEKVDSIWMTASWFNNVVESNINFFKNINQLLIGGDVISPNHVKKVFENHPTIKIVNGYGPTENTTFSTTYEIKNQNYNAVPIGKPIPNSQAYILDQNLNPVSVGVRGKLYVAGAGVARGYLNKPELSREKFVSNPFTKGELMYDTGDLACWMPDGNIEFLGRKDQQVKIRGFRIELAEIENTILLYSKDFVQVVVEAKEVNHEKSLVAYFIVNGNLDKSELQNFLQEKLPDYMIPRFYVELDALPLTSNGKLDRRALPDVNGNDVIRNQYKAPGTKMEKLLASIWSEILSHEIIGIKDNFFNLGGDSIKIIQVISLLKQQNYSLKVKQILEYPFIEDLAKLVESNQVVIDQSEVNGVVMLTPIQYHFLENETISNKNHFNQSVLLKSKKAIDSVVLNKSIATLVLHHDALRMNYKFENNSWMQYNENASEDHYKIEFYDLRNEQNELDALDRIGNELQSGFDITSGILFHVGHFRLSDGDRLALVIHHLVIDGVSWRILFEDLSNLYESYLNEKQIILPAKTDSFQRWASLQKDYAKSLNMQAERSYWELVSNEALPLLPTDFEGENEAMLDSLCHLILDPDLTYKLQTQVHHVYNTEINDVLLTALGLAVRDVFSIEKTIIKMEGHGREEIIEGVDIGRTVGWFTSIFPFILDVSNSDENQLLSVKKSLRKIPNKGIGYGILNYLDRRFSNSFIPSIQFNYLGDFGNNVGGDKNDPLFEFSSENIGVTGEKSQSQVLLDVSGMMISDELSVAITYSGNLFRKETIEKLIASYKTHLEDIIEKLSLHTEVISCDFDTKNQQKWTVGNKMILSPSQKRFYKMERSSVMLRFEMSKFNEHKFEDEFKLFLSKFPVLTLQYEEHNGEIFQRYISADETKFKLMVKDASLLQPEEITQIGEQFLLPEYDLLNGELIRILVFKKDENSEEASVVMAVNHSLSDNYTAKVLKKELNEFFQNNSEVGVYPHPFDFINYQKEFLLSKSGFSDRKYWMDTIQNVSLFKNEIKVRNKYPEFVIQETIISGKDYKRVQKLASDYNLPISALFNAFFQMILNNVKIKEKPLYGILVDSREIAIKDFEVSKILGVIDNMLPQIYSDLIFDMDGIAKSYSKYLEARMYQRIPYETIREDIFRASKKDLDKNIIGYFNFLVDETNISTDNINSEVKIYVDNNPGFEGANLTCSLYTNAIRIKLACVKELYDEKSDLISLENSIKELMNLITTHRKTSDIYTVNT